MFRFHEKGGNEKGCGESTHPKFTVLALDPHRFDGDKDGVGCER